MWREQMRGRVLSPIVLRPPSRRRLAAGGAAVTGVGANVARKVSPAHVAAAASVESRVRQLAIISHELT